MATDVDVQYFSHLNGLALGNNWGDLIRLLDKALVTGIDLTQITIASISSQGDITLNLYAAHNCMLFQIVELAGFAPAELNGKYRIKGVPSTTELILKAEHVGKSITTIGAAKLASLGYEIIFRDTYDVKRIYRAKNPSENHPYIRIDESLSSEEGVYASTYIKSAMVGLLASIQDLDDFYASDVLQLPFSPTEPAKNWKILGTVVNVQRGWSLWHWAWNVSPMNNINATNGTVNGNRIFTLCGDNDAFYFNVAPSVFEQGSKFIYGCGLFGECIASDVIPNWFLFTTLALRKASDGHYNGNTAGGFPLGISELTARFFTTKYDLLSPLSDHTNAIPIMPDYNSGKSGFAGSGTAPSLMIPFKDAQNYLRGTLKHIAYNAKSETINISTTRLADKSMYVIDTLQTSTSETGNGSVVY